MRRRLVIFVAVGGLGATSATAMTSCGRIGDDRFPKVPDAPAPDAVDFTPDAAGPRDAPGGDDAAADATPADPDAG